MKKDTVKYKISPKGKRKLDFPTKTRSSVKLPLVGKTIYLDVKELKHLKRLQADLKKLGGTLEEFVSKDINYLITSQPRPKSKRGDGDQGPELSPAPSPFSYDPSPSPCNPEDRKVVTVTRGKALAEKARIRSKTNTLLDNAEKWGVKIVSLEGAYRWIEKELKKLPRSSQHNGKVSQKTKCVTSFTNFKAPFVKFESTSRAYRAVHGQLESWPRLNVDTPRGSCPFDGTLIARGEHSHEERGEFMAAQVDIFTPDTPREEKDRLGSAGDTPVIITADKSQKKSDTDIFEGSVVLTAGEARKRREQKRRLERKRGYCECCLLKYEDLDKHVRDDQHRAYVRDKSNFRNLDVVIGCVPSTADFVSKYFMNSLAKKSREKHISESQSEEVVLIPITPVKLEKKIASPKCSRKSAGNSEETDTKLNDTKENVCGMGKDKLSPKSMKVGRLNVDDKRDGNEVSESRRSTRTSALLAPNQPKPVVESQETAAIDRPVDRTRNHSNKATVLTCTSPSKLNSGRNKDSPCMPEQSTRNKKGTHLTLSSPRKTRKDFMIERTKNSGTGLTVSSPRKTSKDINTERTNSINEDMAYSSPQKMDKDYDTERMRRTRAGLTFSSPRNSNRESNTDKLRSPRSGLTRSSHVTTKDTIIMEQTRNTRAAIKVSTPEKINKDNATERTRHTRAGLKCSSPHEKDKENREHLSQPSLEASNEATCSPKVLTTRNTVEKINITNDCNMENKNEKTLSNVENSNEKMLSNVENANEKSSSISKSPCRSNVRRNLNSVISPRKTLVLRSPKKCLKTVHTNDENKEVLSPARKSAKKIVQPGDKQSTICSPRSKSTACATISPRTSKIRLRRLSMSPENAKKVPSSKDVVPVLETHATHMKGRQTRNTNPAIGHTASKDLKKESNSEKTVIVPNANRRSPRKRHSKIVSHLETYMSDFAIMSESIATDNEIDEKQQSSVSIPAVSAKMVDTDNIPNASPCGTGPVVAVTSRIDLKPLISTGHVQVDNKRLSNDFKRCILIAMTSGEIPVEQDRIDPLTRDKPMLDNNKSTSCGVSKEVEDHSGSRNQVAKYAQSNDSPVVLDKHVKIDTGSVLSERNDSHNKSPDKRKLRIRNSNKLDKAEDSENIEVAVNETSVSKKSLRNSCLVGERKNVLTTVSRQSPVNAVKSPLKNIMKSHTVAKFPSKITPSDEEHSETSLKNTCNTIALSLAKTADPTPSVTLENKHPIEQNSQKAKPKLNKSKANKAVNEDVKKSKAKKDSLKFSDYLIPSDPASIPSDMAYLLEDDCIIFTKSLAERVKERPSRRPPVDNYNQTVLSQSPQRSRSNSFSSTKSDSSTSRIDKTLTTVGGELKELVKSVMPDEMMAGKMIRKPLSRRKEKLAKTVVSKKLNAECFKTNSESSLTDVAHLSDQNSNSLTETRKKSINVGHAKEGEDVKVFPDRMMDKCDNENIPRQTRHFKNSGHSYKQEASNSSRNKDLSGVLDNMNNHSVSDITTQQIRSRTDDNPIVLGKLKITDREHEMSWKSSDNHHNNSQSPVSADLDIEIKSESAQNKAESRLHKKKLLLKTELDRLKEKYCNKKEVSRKGGYNVGLHSESMRSNPCAESKVESYECSAGTENYNSSSITNSNVEDNSSNGKSQTISGQERGMINLNIPLEKNKYQYSSNESLASDCSSGRKAIVKLRRCRAVVGERSYKQQARTQGLKETKTFITNEIKRLNEERDKLVGNSADSASTSKSTLSSVSKPIISSSPVKQFTHGRTCTQRDKDEMFANVTDNSSVAHTFNKPQIDSPLAAPLKCTTDKRHAKFSVKHHDSLPMSPKRKRKFVKDSDGEERSTSPTFTSTKNSKTFSVKPSNRGGRSASPVFQKSPLSKRLREHEEKSGNKMYENVNPETCNKGSVPSSQECKQKQIVRISRSTRDSIGKTNEKSLSSKNLKKNNYQKQIEVDKFGHAGSEIAKGKSDDLDVNINRDTNGGENSNKTITVTDSLNCSSPPSTPRRKIKITSPGSGYSSTTRENRRRKWKRKTNELHSHGDSELSGSSGHRSKRRKLEKLKFDVSMNETGENNKSCNTSVRSKLNMDDKAEKKVDNVTLNDVHNKNVHVVTDNLNVTINENIDKCNEANDGSKEVCDTGNSSFTLKWDPVATENSNKHVVKLNKSWTMLSERSMAKLLKSEDDRESFDGFTTHEISAESSLPSDLSYEEKEEVEFDKSSEHEWIVEEESTDEEDKADLDKHEFDRLLPATFSSPAKRSDSSWIEACDLYINKSLKESENTSGKELNSPLQFSTTSVRRSPRKKASFSVDAAETEHLSPMHSMGTTPKKKRDKGVGECLHDRETVDQEIEFNYRSPQKYRKDFSPLRVCNGEVVSITSVVGGKVRTSTPNRTRRSLEGKSSKDKKKEPEIKLLKKVSNTKKNISLDHEKSPDSKKKSRRKNKQSI